MLKLMITAASSNSGKTAVTCGLLALLKRRGLEPAAFKCGPDYIDPMFHRSVLGIRSSNLDVFLAGEDGVRQAFARGCNGCEAAICEGVMGFYDGQTADSARASAWHVSQLLDLPAVLVIRPKGAALTLAAVIRGLAEFRPPLPAAGEKAAGPGTWSAEESASALADPKQICGVIFNDCSENYYRTYGPVIERESGIPVLGYLPHMEEAVFESRHLGLMTAEEIQDLGARIDRIAVKMEETLDLERLFEVMRTPPAAKAGPAPSAEPDDEGCCGAAPDYPKDVAAKKTVRIAVARDAAFNFIYSESIAALEEAGAEIIYFSPLKDQALPPNIHGLYLPGGYPELHTRQLSENRSMRESIRAAVMGEEFGLPTIAECGGFLYLGKSLADADGRTWPMVGALPGHGAGTGRLVRFGYGYIGCDTDSMLFRAGEQIPVHEFHYWDTTEPGSDLTLTKNSNGKQWTFGYAAESLYAGFPHLYLAGTCGTGTCKAERRGKGSGDIETSMKRECGDIDTSLKRECGGSGDMKTLAARFVQAARSFSERGASACGTIDAEA